MKTIIGILIVVLLIGTTVFGDDGAPMVLVPAGEFIMGPPGAEKTVHLKNFYIDKYEVTVGQFKKFVKETGYVTTAERLGYTQDGRGKYYGYNWKNTNYKFYSDNYPITCISPEDSEAYAKWAGKDYLLRLSGRRQPGVQTDASILGVMKFLTLKRWETLESIQGYKDQKWLENILQVLPLMDVLI
jgi:hypothetical protein